MSENFVDGFNPIFDSNSKILILGSFPSVKSRQNGFYYGNPRNRFWGVLAEIFNEETPTTNEDKIEFILKHNLALWDVAIRSDIKGSLDSNLKNYEVSNLHKVLDFSKISFIIFNGKKSYEIFSKHYNLPIKSYCLPSTSPANLSFSINKWKEAFEEILND